MDRAIELGELVRTRTSPNPWVGCVLLTSDGRAFDGATEAPGARHGERVALDAAVAAGANTQGSTVVVTLEPCSHHGRTPPCADALIDAGVTTVVVALEDPDSHVAGRGIARLRAQGVDVITGIRAAEAEDSLRAYLHHRRTGRPFVIAKLTATLDGATAAADGSSQWITGPEARREVHRLRAHSDAIIVGAGTVRADDPELTTRLVEGPDPLRIVLGTAPPDARVQPCREWHGSLDDLLDDLGHQGVLQVLVEGGARVAASFHAADLIDRFVIHFAPALMGGSDATGVFEGSGAATIGDLRRGRILGTRQLGEDLEVVLDPRHSPGSAPED